VTARDRRPFGGLLAANAVSITGNILTVLAIPWFVLQTTGSATRTGIAAGASSLPIMLSAAFSGTFADRIGHRRASVVSDLVSAAVVVSVPVLHATVGLEFWQLLCLVFLRSLFATPGETARGALLPDLTEPAGVSLERATSLYDAVSRGARMVGAPLAGVLIAVIGAPNLLLLDAATFVLSALIVLRLVPPPERVVRERAPYLTDLREGLRYVRGERLIRNIVLLCMTTNMLDAGYGAVFLPVHAKTVLHSAVALGLVFAASAGSAFAGALTFGAFGAHLPRRRTFVIAYVLCGIPRFAVLALRAPLPVIVAVTLVSGFSAGCLNPIMDTSMFERLPENMRARVFGVVFAGCTAAMPLGALVAGTSVAGFGLAPALWAFGLAYLAVTIAPAFLPSWRGLERQVPVRMPAPQVVAGQPT
jgi:MFS family permease